jgi:hypothetical protein
VGYPNFSRSAAGMISITDEREVPMNHLYIGDTFELLGDFCDDCKEPLMRIDTQTTLDGKLHLGYVNMQTGTSKYICETLIVRKINVAMRIY